MGHQGSGAPRGADSQRAEDSPWGAHSKWTDLCRAGLGDQEVAPRTRAPLCGDHGHPPGVHLAEGNGRLCTVLPERARSWPGPPGLRQGGLHAPPPQPAQGEGAWEWRGGGGCWPLEGGPWVPVQVLPPQAGLPREGLPAGLALWAQRGLGQPYRSRGGPFWAAGLSQEGASGDVHLRPAAGWPMRGEGGTFAPTPTRKP